MVDIFLDKCLTDSVKGRVMKKNITKVLLCLSVSIVLSGCATTFTKKPNPASEFYSETEREIIKQAVLVS
ncbi:MAG: hypothetical protein PWQ06_2496 [Anaerophaga sp.]|jgi:hypothetical protein|nr:hypothetical protein [Anaerophaga sp.]